MRFRQCSIFEKEEEKEEETEEETEGCEGQISKLRK